MNMAIEIVDVPNQTSIYKWVYDDDDDDDDDDDTLW